jgi:hypothetical protein
VWQYLKAYSIHQENIPPDPFVFDSTELLMEAVRDTLKGDNYTCYSRKTAGDAAAMASIAAAGGANPQTVFFDRLTDSVACITADTIFEDWSWDDFKRCAVDAQGYPYIVIDIRHNMGGRIDILDSIVAALVPAGTSYLQAKERRFDLKTRTGVMIDWHHWKTQTELLPWFGGKRKKYVVIMDGLTASASEILAAALYEGAGAMLIGTRSYGKGMGQTLLDRRTRRPLQITSLLFEGVSFRIGKYHRRGISPDSVPLYITGAVPPGRLTDWQKEIFYAAKLLQRNITPDSIAAYPPKRFAGGPALKMASGCYKVVREEEAGR